jgi:hypothetical protein
VNIIMATRTAEPGKMIESDSGAFTRFMALVTRDRFMGIFQRKTGLLVQSQGVIGCLKGSSVMAAFAAIEPRRGRELPIMLILVAVHTEFEIDLIACFLARGNMAIGALYLGVRHY